MNQSPVKDEKKSMSKQQEKSKSNEEKEVKTVSSLLMRRPNFNKKLRIDIRKKPLENNKFQPIISFYRILCRHFGKSWLPNKDSSLASLSLSADKDFQHQQSEKIKKDYSECAALVAFFGGNLGLVSVIKKQCVITKADEGQDLCDFFFLFQEISFSFQNKGGMALFPKIPFLGEGHDNDEYDNDEYTFQYYGDLQEDFFDKKFFYEMLKKLLEIKIEDIFFDVIFIEYSKNPSALFPYIYILKKRQTIIWQSLPEEIKSTINLNPAQKLPKAYRVWQQRESEEIDDLMIYTQLALKLGNLIPLLRISNDEYAKILEDEGFLLENFRVKLKKTVTQDLQNLLQLMKVLANGDVPEQITKLELLVKDHDLSTCRFESHMLREIIRYLQQMELFTEKLLPFLKKLFEQDISKQNILEPYIGYILKVANKLNPQAMSHACLSEGNGMFKEKKREAHEESIPSSENGPTCNN